MAVVLELGAGPGLVVGLAAAVDVGIVDILRVGAAVVPLALSFAAGPDASPFVVALEDALAALIVDGFLKALVVAGFAGSAAAVVGFDAVGFA